MTVILVVKLLSVFFVGKLILCVGSEPFVIQLQLDNEPSGSQN